MGLTDFTRTVVDGKTFVAFDEVTPTIAALEKAREALVEASAYHENSPNSAVAVKARAALAAIDGLEDK